jgi:hypothetical protein
MSISFSRRPNMIGLPKDLKTKQDWLNAVEYAKSTGEGKAELKNRLMALKNQTTVLVLKAASIDKLPEEQTEADYEPVPDPACEKLRLGFTDSEINDLIGGLK